MKRLAVCFRGNFTVLLLLITSWLLVVLLPSTFLTPSSRAWEAHPPIVPSPNMLLFPLSGRVTIPFNFDEAKILIPVWIDKKYLFMMHLDNAWSITTFTKEAIEMTSLQLGDFMDIPVMGIGGKSYIRGTTLIVGHLKIGELEVENHRVAVLDWEDYLADGIVGCDIIYSIVTTVDYDNRQITFSRADAETPLNLGASVREIVPFSIIPWEYVKGGKVVFPVKLPELKPVEGRLDLGSGQSVMSWQLAYKLGISRYDPGLKRGRTLRGGDGRPVRSWVWEFSSLQIGSITIKRPLSIYIADLEVFEKRPVILIGNDVLQHLGKFSLHCGKQQLIIYRR